jgi:hypothetical protein
MSSSSSQLLPSAAVCVTGPATTNLAAAAILASKRKQLLMLSPREREKEAEGKLKREPMSGRVSEGFIGGWVGEERGGRS